MKKIHIGKILNSSKFFVKKHSPEILSGLGVAGVITTTIMAVKATPNALKLIDEYKENNDKDDIKIFETIKVAGVCYIPTTIIGVVSISCIMGASTISFKRNAALATAYKLSEAALKEYSDKVVEVIGEKKEKTIRDAVFQDEINKHPVKNKEIYITNKGETLCYDGISGRVFKGNIDQIRKSVNELNREMRNEMFISLSEFYDEIGLRHTDISDYIGWNIDTTGYIDIDTSAILTEDEKPCIYISYRNRPIYGFDDLY